MSDDTSPEETPVLEEALEEVKLEEVKRKRQSTETTTPPETP